MAAPKGNKFWEARSSHGRKPKFRSADDLWTACKEYFEWVQDNPLWEAKAFSFQGDVTVETLPKMRAMTINGLCIFLDIEQETWRLYRNRKGFIAVVTRVEGIIREQKFTGAAAELLNPNIIARDLGLANIVESKLAIKPESESISEIDAWIERTATGETAGENKKTRTH